MKYFLKVAFAFALCSFIAVAACNFMLNRNGNQISSEPTMVQQESSTADAVPAINDNSVSEITAKEKPQVSVSSFETYPGEMIVLKGKELDSAVVTSVLSEKISVYSTGDKDIIALIPIKYTKEPGEYYITVSANDFKEDILITVKEKSFTKVELEVDQGIADNTINSQKANDEYFQKVQPLKTKNLDLVLWKGSFQQPVENFELTSDFGDIRVVNSKEEDRHGGIDMSAPLGTPVYAANDGKVIFAENIALTGNTIMIEHGLGLKSHYYHMNSLAVKSGDTVKKGDKIGEIGTTGFSTGPHLHFAVSVEKVYVNPHTLFETDYTEFMEE